MKYKIYFLQVISAGLLLWRWRALRAEQKIAMKAANWKTTGAVEFVQHNGVEAINEAGNRDMKMKGASAAYGDNVQEQDD
jgi:hypothetical protein